MQANPNINLNLNSIGQNIGSGVGGEVEANNLINPNPMFIDSLGVLQ